MINAEYFFYSVTLRTKSKYFVSSSVNRQDLDYDSCEESSFSVDESESNFGDSFCPFSPGAKYPGDKRVFVGY